MAFILEFAENLILRLMEDPVERDRKFRDHMYDLREHCEKTKEMWSYPIRPYGFWTFDRHNSQIFWDAQISHVRGRRDPYDDLLREHQGLLSTELDKYLLAMMIQNILIVAQDNLKPVLTADSAGGQDRTDDQFS
ncbi:hypothetical protein Ccrd_000046 [Cynara cardunculus var. scolymus]|uniref:Uncharacterized protein n=1 Tax=Cynara cardunculus var. scolymus TaxID=59895 RepID=A0A103XVV7_CYNCS|nr:hypothetical protein Ccrd_000046 [Cynara cardunculus var. scolymus]